jgi:hypothetical protein
MDEVLLLIGNGNGIRAFQVVTDALRQLFSAAVQKMLIGLLGYRCLRHTFHEG